MKTAMTQTSLDAYRSLSLNEQQKEVLIVIKICGASCIADVAAYLYWERSTVSGRMNDLKKLGAIIFVGKRKSKQTGVMSEFYRAKEYKQGLF